MSKVLDHNPYHDEKGRFTFAPGGRKSAGSGVVPKDPSKNVKSFMEEAGQPFVPASEADKHKVAEIMKGEVSVMMDQGSLEGLIEEGRFIPARESGYTSRNYPVKERTVWENNIFGETSGDGPVYGFMGNENSIQAVDQVGYGEIRVILDDSVLDDSTITFGDSLDANALVKDGHESSLERASFVSFARPSAPAHARDQAGLEEAYANSRYGFAAERAYGFNGTTKDLSVRRSQGMDRGFDYAEVQMWKAPTLDKVKKIVVMEDENKGGVDGVFAGEYLVDEYKLILQEYGLDIEVELEQY